MRRRILPFAPIAVAVIASIVFAVRFIRRSTKTAM